MRLTKYGETDLPELNGVHDLSQTARSNILPLKYGSIDLDGNETVLNHKQISATAVINTDFDDTMDDLAYEAQKGARVLQSTMRDNSKRQLLAKITVFSRGAKAEKYTCEQEYGFQWLAMYPYWLHSDDEPYYSNHGYTSQSGISTGDENTTSTTINSTSVSFTINNTSRVRIPKVVFNLTFDGADINKPKITNLTNGMFIYVNKFNVGGTGLGVKSLLSIDCLSKKIYLAHPEFTSPSEHNIYSYVETNPSFMDWMILEPGNNSFVVTSTAITSTPVLKTHWSRHYV